MEDLSPQLFLGNDRLAATYARKKAGEWDIGSAVLSVPDFKVEARFPGRFILAIAQDGRTTLSMTFKSNELISHDTHFAYELWDLQTKKMLHFLDIGKHMRQFASSFRLGGKELLAYIDGSFNRPADAAHIKPHVRVFDTATGKETGMVKDVEVAASLAPDGKTYALDTGALDLGWLRPMHTGGQSVVSIKNRRTGRETYARPTIELLQRGRVVGLHYLPDSRHVVVVTSLAVMIWDTDEDEVIPFKGKLSRVPVRVRFTQTENGLVFATVSSNGDMQVWRASLPVQKP